MHQEAIPHYFDRKSSLASPKGHLEEEDPASCEIQICRKGSGEPSPSVREALHPIVALRLSSGHRTAA
ncbi:MAG: hypothetical protein RLZZ627_1682 [Pseudomonadota bacterium]|jgi:hypothetical protein